MNGDGGDPRHIDPAGDLASMVEDGTVRIELDDDQDEDDLREFIERAEAGEFSPADPGLEASVRIARAILEQEKTDGVDWVDDCSECGSSRTRPTSGNRPEVKPPIECLECGAILE